MKSILLLVLLIATTSFVPRRVAKEKWVVLKGCTLKIAGSTNINKFSCEVKEFSNPDTLQLCNIEKGSPISFTGSLALPIFSFDCNNNMMTSDLRKTLKASEFPMLKISFLLLNKYPDFTATQERIDGTVCIVLAGVAKTFIVNYRISRDAGKVIHLTGNQTIKFSDFGLDRPQRIGGAVKAKDKLDVEFRINFRMI
ncbi:YceI family protein [Chitinophaga sp. SYP-B3965]|uniref:YceI family protein n=1 Tax=Chitinophaga sp. SYP-B3965 TaxID=2663120 RepID=UPI0012997755|nr:YceI family protein [Chitinophaga sp. SYP-B3965]MRG45337.1 YceI family protein [Chitinophaga sp. SYP-B3965]